MTLSEGVFVAAFAISVWIRAKGERLGAEMRELARPHQGVDTALIVGMAIGAVFLPATHLTTGSLAFADYRLPGSAAVLGTLAAAVGLWLLNRAHRDLGANWSRMVALKNGHVLVVGGVYARMRHPMYLAIGLICLAQGLLVHNVVAGWSGLSAFALMYTYRVPREERLLRARFGSEYLEYCRTTPRHWPRWRAARR